MALSLAGDLQKLIRVSGAAPGFVPYTPEVSGPVYLNNQTVTDVAQAKAALPNATVYNLTADQYAQLQVNFRNAQRNNHGFWNDFVINVLPMFASVAIPALGQYGAAAAAGTAASAAASPSLASIIGNLAPYIGTALRAGLTRDANATRLGLSAPSLAEPSPLTEQLGLSSTGGFDPFGLDDQVFLGSLAAAADANSPPPSLNTDAIVLPVALLLLGLAWWYVRKK